MDTDAQVKLIMVVSAVVVGLIVGQILKHRSDKLDQQGKDGNIIPYRIVRILIFFMMALFYAGAIALTIFVVLPSFGVTYDFVEEGIESLGISAVKVYKGQNATADIVKTGEYTILTVINIFKIL